MNPVELLKRMIALPSFSRREEATADMLYDSMVADGFAPRRYLNNVWACSEIFSDDKPTLLLNSHHDTVCPTPAYTLDPFLPVVSDGKLYGLGSNDAGASVVTLFEVFRRLRSVELPFNLLLALTAEEEVTGEGGMRAFLPHLAESGISIDMALVGEPTGMQPAVAERGLVVLDCISRGMSGHAARNEGVNALYKAMDDIGRLRAFRFAKESAILGPITAQVTQIQAGTQHNVVPDECRWVIDVRTTDAYTNEETVKIIASLLDAEAKPRSTRVRASVIDNDHPMVRAARLMGKTPFVSPTTSDMSQMSAFASLKMGPGDSARSHSADEYVHIAEIEDAIEDYILYLNQLSNIIKQA